MQTTTALTARISTRRRSLRLIVTASVAAAALFASTLPAAAQPAGPGNEAVPVNDPDDPGIPPGGGEQGDPDPSVLVSGTPRCEPAPGVDYQVTLTDGPNRPHVLTFHWENVDTGESGNGGPAGSVDTGEGSIHLTGIVIFPPAPIVVNGQVVGVLPQLTADHEILVDVVCPGEEPGGEDPEEDPNEDPGFDPDVRSATPTFTG